MTCGADTEANSLLTALLAGKTFEIPDIDLSGPEYTIPYDPNSPLYRAPTKLTNADLTTKVLNGTGTFDVIMSSLSVHLKEEYSAGRITGAEYTKAYTALVESALQNAVQYLTNRDQVFWQAQQIQYQAMTAKIASQTAKVQLAAVQLEAANSEATFALTKLKLSSESMAYCTAKFSLDEILPIQKKLVQEQYEAGRAQTLDTRSDGGTVAGTMGKQVALYTQQITSYQRDAETKVAKLFTDAWITQKTIDEGLLPPDGFKNASLDQILTTLKINNSLIP